jgi:hypothetical protein
MRKSPPPNGWFDLMGDRQCSWTTSRVPGVRNAKRKWHCGSSNLKDRASIRARSNARNALAPKPWWFRFPAKQTPLLHRRSERLAGQRFLPASMAMPALRSSLLIERARVGSSCTVAAGPDVVFDWAPARSSRHASLRKQALGRERRTLACASINQKKVLVNSISVTSCNVTSCNVIS